MSALLRHPPTSEIWLGAVSLPIPPTLTRVSPPAERAAALLACAEAAITALTPAGLQTQSRLRLNEVTFGDASPILAEKIGVSAARLPTAAKAITLLVYAGPTLLARISAETDPALPPQEQSESLILIVAQKTAIIEALVARLSKENHDVVLLDPLSGNAFQQSRGQVIADIRPLDEIADIFTLLLDRRIASALVFPEGAPFLSQEQPSVWVASLLENLLKFQSGTVIELTGSDLATSHALPSGHLTLSAGLPVPMPDESPSESADRILQALTMPSPLPQKGPHDTPADRLPTSATRDRLHGLLRRALSLPSATDLTSGGLGLTPGWDSLKHIQLLLEIEEYFGIDFTSAEIEKSQQVVQIERLLDQKLS